MLVKGAPGESIPCSELFQTKLKENAVSQDDPVTGSKSKN